MDSIFLSQNQLYNGNYSFTKRDATHEFLQDCHYHDFYEVQFYLCESETGHIGEITINNETSELKQGCLVLINMFSPHKIKIDCDVPYIRYCVSFDSSLLLFACSDQSNLFNIFSNCAKAKSSLPLSTEQINTFITIYNKHERLPLTNGKDILEKSLILEIFAHIYDIFYEGQQISDTDMRNMTTLTKLIQYIDNHISEELSLDVLAEYVSFSTFHLSRMFKRYTGTTLNKYIVSKRIDKAKLLLQSPLPINSVSIECGFNNYTHFYRTFKALTGINPAEYKDRQST